MTGEIFRIGEIAILWNADCPCSHHNGQECEIVALPRAAEYLSPLSNAWIDAGKYMVHYIGEVWQVSPKHLRKRRPPQDPAFVRFRDQLVREISATSPARHPAIASMLDLIGQGERA